ncbi:uncharacterized protein PV07_09946 [Cladophialophora immunda]|uniref:glutathione transferase n=1 Tax=Cladophialophora immunda TaxID=569365 RepID=A0A0D2BYJ9_9EURO|nr:uncharacterized protein PV07_09946 [Cladophialophora immunda]KIW24218.1 hypothetical protein PV07_09946 [Cladophialophora immunda]OQV07595.1 Glutathione S-transferase, domain-containing protein [Cladophialophora immunda]
MTPRLLQEVLKSTNGIPEFSNDKSHAHIRWTEMLPDDLRDYERHTSMQKNEHLVNPRREFLLRQYNKFRRWASIAAGITSVISALLSAFMESIMIYTIYKFYTTKTLFVEGRPWGPWARDSVLWPTFMLAVASIVTSLLALTALVALWCRAKHKAAFFSLLYAAVHIVAWVVVSVLYRVEKTEKDLWGWSCTDKARAIQQQLGSRKLNFESLCRLQASSWEVSVAEVVIKILTTSVSWYFSSRQEGLKTEIVGEIGSAVFNQTEDFRAKSIFGRVPLVEDGDVAIFESRAIARYLCLKYADVGPRLMPESTDVKVNGVWEMRLTLEAIEFDSHVAPVIGETLIRPALGKATDEAVVARHKPKLLDCLDVLDKALSKTPYMGGTEYSLVDIFYMPCMFTVSKCLDVFEGRPNLRRWWETVSAREAWKEVVKPLDDGYSQVVPGWNK